MKKAQTALALVSAVFLFLAPQVLSQAPVEERSNSSGEANSEAVDASLQLLLEMQSLRDEIAFLRGTIEELQYQLGKVERQQQENYEDLDNRVRDLYLGAATTVSPLPSGPAASTTVPALTPVTPSEPAVPEGPTSAELYEQGFNALRLGERDQAIDSFSQLVETYPDASEAADALYWLGETYWLANRREESRQAFVQLLDQNPSYRKAGDAQYRLGIIYEQLGDIPTATNYMRMVVEANASQSLAANTWLSEHQIPADDTSQP